MLLWYVFSVINDLAIANLKKNFKKTETTSMSSLRMLIYWWLLGMTIICSEMNWWKMQSVSQLLNRKIDANFRDVNMWLHSVGREWAALLSQRNLALT